MKLAKHSWILVVAVLELLPVSATFPWQSVPPKFLQEPADTYVIKHRPATLVCRASHALRLFFTCNDKRAQSKEYGEQAFVEPMTGVRQLELRVDVHRADVDEHAFLDGYGCRCHAWNSAGESRSRRALIRTTHLRKHFAHQPYSQTVEINSQIEFKCLPPEGDPDPSVYWLRNGEVLDTKKTGSNFLVSSEGSLVVIQAHLADMANYTCVAANPAGKRYSDTVILTVVVNGAWSPWSAWSECNTKCGKGQRKRVRVCNNPSSLNGGTPCLGNYQQRIDCNVPCPALDGHWTSWSSWTPCNSDCKQLRHRSCTNPPPAQGGNFCPGSHRTVTNCTTDDCKVAGDALYDNSQLRSVPQEAPRVMVETNIALYAGIVVAMTICFAFVAAIYFFRRKESVQSIYSTSVSVTPNNLIHRLSNEEKTPLKLPIWQDLVPISLDPSQNIKPLPYADEPLDVTLRQLEMITEHVYAIPALPAANQKSTKVRFRMDPVVEYSTPPQSPSTPENEIVYSNSRPSTFPDGIEVDSIAWTNVTREGAKLSIPGSGVALTIAENALGHNDPQEVYIAILKPNKLNLKGNQTILSPLIICGPSDVLFNKPVILNFPHCACLSQGSWHLSLFQSPTTSPMNWQELTELEKEAMLFQLDSDCCYIMTKYLTPLVLVGQSAPQRNAMKTFCLAAFASPLPTSTECNLRIYCVDDTSAALEGVFMVEKKLGGLLMNKPKSMFIQDNGCDLCLNLEELGAGWRIRPGTSHQKIPFSHLWNGFDNFVHCSFLLERLDQLVEMVTCNIYVYQSDAKIHRQILRIHTSLQEKNLWSPRMLRPKPKEKSCAVTTIDRKTSTVIFGPTSCVFRIPPELRKELGQCLDTPIDTGNDWRMLARSLNVDSKNLVFFANHPSPTDLLLDLWETRNRDPTAVMELLNILRVMGRLDAAMCIENKMGCWL